VLPRLPGTQPVKPNAASAVDEINQRFNTWSVAAAHAAAMWSTLLLIWLRDVETPSAARGLRKLGFPALAALRRSAIGRTQVSARRPTTSSIANPTVVAPSTRAPKRVTRNAPASGARRAKTVSARGKSVTGRADRRRETNGSKKRRQSRLAS